MLESTWALWLDFYSARLAADLLAAVLAFGYRAFALLDREMSSQDLLKTSPVPFIASSSMTFKNDVRIPEHFRSHKYSRRPCHPLAFILG